MERIYLAGGCLWVVQHFFKSIPGVLNTEAGRVNGSTNSIDGEYDGYAECVRVDFDEKACTVNALIEYLFEIIDPYSINKQGIDEGPKYRTGIYSTLDKHIEEARDFIASRDDCEMIAVEVKPLVNYVRSADEHQDRLERCPEDYSYCHIPIELMNKYRIK